MSRLCAPMPPTCGPKCSPRRWALEILRPKKRISSWPPCTQPPVRAVSYVWATTLNFGPDVQLWDLADFSLIFRVSELPKVCAFISQKLSKLRRRFFIFPDNFCCSIRICKNFHSVGHGSGATVPPKRFQKPKFQNLHFFARLLWSKG